MSEEDAELLKEVKRRLDMISEQERIKSFGDNWPYKDPANCTSNRLAEAGFYFVGGPEEPDSVKCFLCNKNLDGWDENDDPWEEHISHSKDCKFAQLQLPEDSLMLGQFIDIVGECAKSCVKQRSDTLLQKLIERILTVPFSKKCVL